MFQQIISSVISLLIFYAIIELFKRRKHKTNVYDESATYTYDQKTGTITFNDKLPKFEPYNPEIHDPSDFIGRRPNTKFEQRKIDAQMKAFLESNPNHSFWKDHPEYKEKYLSDIDLTELDL